MFDLDSYMNALFAWCQSALLRWNTSEASDHHEQIRSALGMQADFRKTCRVKLTI